MRLHWLGKWVRFGALAAVMGVLGLAGAGCDSGDDGGGGDSAGVWALYGGSTIAGSPVWYLHLQSDGSYFISDNADGSGVRVTGTYSDSGNTITGPFNNPGVGEGRIDATISGGVMQLNFVEYWHTPNKVVPYAGQKI